MLVPMLPALAPATLQAQLSDATPGLTLVRDGRSAYTIVVPDDALPVEFHAAQ